MGEGETTLREEECVSESVRAPIIQHMPETKCISEPDMVTVHEGAVRAAGGEQTNMFIR